MQIKITEVNKTLYSTHKGVYYGEKVKLPYQKDNRTSYIELNNGDVVWINNELQKPLPTFGVTFNVEAQINLYCSNPANGAVLNITKVF